MGNLYKQGNKIPLVNESFYNIIYNMEGLDTGIMKDTKAKKKKDVLTGIGGLTSSALVQIFKDYDAYSKANKKFKPQFDSKILQDMYNVYQKKKKAPQWNQESLFVTETSPGGDTFKTKFKNGHYSENEIKEFGNEAILDYANIITESYNNKLKAYNENKSIAENTVNAYNDLSDYNENIVNTFASILYNRPHGIDNNTELFDALANKAQDSQELVLANQILKLRNSFKIDNRRLALTLYSLTGPLTKETIQDVDANLKDLNKLINTAKVCSDIIVDKITDNNSFEENKETYDKQCDPNNIFSYTWSGVNQKMAVPESQSKGTQGIYKFDKGWKQVDNYPTKEENNNTVTQPDENQQKEQSALDKFVNSAVSLGETIKNFFTKDNKNDITKSAGEVKRGNTDINL